MQGEEHPTIPPQPQVTLLRFSLRRLFIYIGLLCVLLAGLAATDGLLLVALLLVALVVGAHVLSTCIGTRLRDGSTTVSRWEGAHGRSPSEPNLAVDQQPIVREGTRAKTAHQLQGRGPVVRRLSLLVAGGSIAGAAGGLWIMLATFWPRIGAATIVAGCLAAAILGGWIAFLACSFFGITRRAWQEAVQNGANDRYSLPQTATGKKAPGPSWARIRR